jgi:hypothetical protein
MNGAMEQGPMDRAEWRWALGWGAVVIVLSCLPYIYAYTAAPSSHTFGGFLVNYLDGNSYLAKMREGYDGDWLFRLAFTPEKQSGLLVFTLYLALGHLAKATGLPLIVVFHIARAASGLFLLTTVYRLAAEFTADRSARRWAFAIAAGGGGLAILSLALGRSNAAQFAPVDLLVPEAFGFYSTLTNPHFCLAFALEAWAVLLVIRPTRWNRAVLLVVLVLAGLGIASMAPYLTPVVWVTIGAGLMFRRPLDSAALWRAGIVLGASGLLLAYEYWAMTADPVIAGWARQNQTPSPAWLDVFLGLGLWLPMAGVGAWRAWDGRRDVPTLAALLTWLLVSLVLVFIPYALQRRFLGGIFMPLDVLAGGGVAWVWTRAGRARRLAAAGTILLGFSSTALVLLALFSAPATADPKMYLTFDETAGLLWLDAQGLHGDIVLADSRLGLFVPGWTGARSVYGHPMETLDAAAKRAEVDNYYAHGDAALLQRYSVRFVLGGPQPAGWHVVFRSRQTVIYGR